jgi:small conductance mechanosensitive channel
MTAPAPLMSLPDPMSLSPAQLWARYGSAAMDGLLAIAGAIVVLVVGLWLAGVVARAIRRFAKKNEHFDDTLGTFFSSVARWAIWAFTGVAVLSFFGIDTTSIVAVLGAATLAIGLALQGTLSNVAAGVMLVVFRPYKLGDFVEIAGRRGVVRDIRLFTTEMDTLDNVRVFLPNGQCWGAPILNFSTNPTRRVDVELTLPFTADVARARAQVLGVLAGRTDVLAEPAAFIRVDRLNEYGVVLGVRVWANTGAMIGLRHDLLEQLPRALAEAGIPPAYPTSVSLEYGLSEAP